MPQLNSVKIKGLGPFRKEVFVDFDALPGKVIAVTGENGAGKTSFLEIGFPGPIFRHCPTRGPLIALAGEDRAAYVESVYTLNGSRYTLRQLVDGVSKKGEAVVTNGDGTALTTSGKLKEFDAWSEKVFPPEKIFYSSLFTPQAYGGFLTLPSSERKEVILKVLGIDHYESLADLARQKANEAKIRVDNARERLTELDAKPTLADAEYELTMQQQAVESSGLELIRLRQAVQAATDELIRVREHNADLRAQEQRRGELSRRRQTQRQALTDIETRIRNNNDLVNKSEEINNAAARIKEIDEQVAQLSTDLETLNAAIALCRANQTAAIEAAQDAESRALNARQKVARYQETLKDSEAVTEAITAIPDTETALRNAIDTEELARTALTNLRNQALTSRDDRIDELRTGHDEIGKLETSLAAAIYRAQDISREAIDSDNQAVTLEAAYPAKIAAAERYVQECTIEVAAWREKLTNLERLAGKASMIENVAAELETSQHDAENNEAIVREKNAAARQLKTELDEHLQHQSNLTNDIRTLRTERTGLQATADLSDTLKVATTRLEELEAQRLAVAGDIAALTTQLEEMPEASPELSLPNVDAAKAELTTAETADREAHRLLTQARMRCDEARQAETQRTKLRADLVALEADYADKKRLTDDFGRDGLQALEIDAVGPELSETINDLLRTCIGSRWTVSIETTRMSAKLKKQIEGCDVIVSDNETNQVLNGEMLSGGQRVIIGEAISLALAMFNLRRANIKGATLVRDESGAALSPRYAPKYLAMLRRAIEILENLFGGVWKILFVSHNPDIQQLADATIHINDDGTIAIG